MQNLTAEQLRDAIAARLATRYDVVDLDPAPADCNQPSAFVDLQRVRPQRIAPGMYECTATVQITVCLPQDSLGLSPREALLREQLAVMELFRAGYLTIGARAPRVEVSTGGITGEKAYVDLTARYVVPVDPHPADTGVIEETIEHWGMPQNTRR